MALSADIVGSPVSSLVVGVLWAIFFYQWNHRVDYTVIGLNYRKVRRRHEHCLWECVSVLKVATWLDSRRAHMWCWWLQFFQDYEYWRSVTATLSHLSFMHIVFNVGSLYTFSFLERLHGSLFYVKTTVLLMVRDLLRGVLPPLVHF